MSSAYVLTDWRISHNGSLLQMSTLKVEAKVILRLASWRQAP
jgi:hypothetical protein